ncbi:MAG: ATP-grasp domain-containing protein [Thermosynechococcaceae cyanobacterium]
MKIYNHDIMTCTHEAVDGNHLYSGRVLGMTNPEDLIQLHPDLQPDWSTIIDHYHRVGLNPSTNVIWDISHERIEDYPDYVPSVFYFGDALHQESCDRNYFHQLDQHWHSVVEFINSKNNFMQLAQELGIAVPYTQCYKETAEVTGEVPYPCYLKPAVSVDGVGIVRCETEVELNQALQQMSGHNAFQIQEEVVASTFLNLQYYAADHTAKPLAASEQILDGCAHGGNRYPTAHQPWNLVTPMAQWMAEQGMKDVFAFDVAVDERGAEPRYLAIECNPRFNGASYPTGIAHKLGITSWSCETFRTKYRTLGELDLKDIEFNPETGTGVIIVNWGPIQVGKLVILLAGSDDDQQPLRQALRTRLSSAEEVGHH